MAKKLGPDGRPIDVPTKPTANKGSPKPKKKHDPLKGAGATRSAKTGRRIDLGEEPTVAVGAGRQRQARAGGSGDTTRPALSFPSDGDTRSMEPDSDGSPQRRPYRPGDEGDTVVWRGADRPGRGAEATSATRAAQVHPVTGWLVVVDGPGKGSAAQLGFGHNTIGRGPAMRVRLDFGDGKISRDTHATLTYDPKGNDFYLQQGKNLAYIDDKPVLNPVRLQAGALIGLGDTTLRFVPFCDDAFTWE